MGSREDFHMLLKTITPNVYYQKPSSGISYPAIIYERRRLETTKANNKVYGVNKSYLLTVIDKKPDSPIIDKVVLLDMCTHDRHYVYDGFHHDTFIIYY